MFRQLHKAYRAGLTTKEEKLDEGSYRGTGFFFLRRGAKLNWLFPSHGPLSVGAEPKLEFYIMYLSEYSSFSLHIFPYLYVAQICSKRTLMPFAYSFIFLSDRVSAFSCPFQFWGQCHFYKLPKFM